MGQVHARAGAYRAAQVDELAVEEVAGVRDADQRGRRAHALQAFEPGVDGVGRDDLVLFALDHQPRPGVRRDAVEIPAAARGRGDRDQQRGLEFPFS